jgi:hypothetical protein
LIAAIHQRADDLETRFAAVEKSLDFISQQYDTLVKEIASQKALNADLQKGLEKVSKQMYEKDIVVNQLTARVNQLEQSSLAQTIEIHGVPVRAGENLQEKVQMIATKIGAPDVAGTVDDMYLIPPAKTVNNKPRPGYIVVRLKHHSAKVAWLLKLGRGSNSSRGRSGRPNSSRVAHHLTTAPAPQAVALAPPGPMLPCLPLYSASTSSSPHTIKDSCSSLAPPRDILTSNLCG